MSLRDRVLASTTSFKPVAVEAPELGGTVWVRPLTIAGVSRFQAIAQKEPARVPVTLLIECMCDEMGARLFTAADEAAVGEIPSESARRIAEVITSISKLDPKGGPATSGE